MELGSLLWPSALWCFIMQIISQVTVVISPDYLLRGIARHEQSTSTVKLFIILSMCPWYPFKHIFTIEQFTADDSMKFNANRVEHRHEMSVVPPCTGR